MKVCQLPDIHTSPALIRDDLSVWRSLWMPLLTSLARQSSNSHRNLRNNSLAHLQRIFLGPQITSIVPIPVPISPSPLSTSPPSPNPGSSVLIDTTLIFSQIIFPLMNSLLQLVTLARDPNGIPETRLRASMMLCKVFLHFKARPLEQQRGGQDENDIKDIWLGVLEFQDHFMHSGRQPDQLVCASLLLVICSLMLICLP